LRVFAWGRLELLPKYEINIQKSGEILLNMFKNSSLSDNGDVQFFHTLNPTKFIYHILLILMKKESPW